jgi:UDP-N-acetyl-D-mannosaminuronate dehydrogenase
MNGLTVVVGLGEVGDPLFRLIERAGCPAVGIDVETDSYPQPGSVDVMHICFPCQVDDFVGEAERYINLMAPRLTVINSTVPVGTTRTIQMRTGARLAYSPIRGKHSAMLEQLTRYVKFVGAADPGAAVAAADHFALLGMKTCIVDSPEAAELAKLTETTYFGLLIAWAQTIDRWCEEAGVDYDDVVSFYEEIPFFPPVKYFPGVIGGHCVMPNIDLVSHGFESAFLDAIRSSNAKHLSREEARVAIT